MEKKVYEEVKMEVLVFGSEDVIVTSGIDESDIE